MALSLSRELGALRFSVAYKPVMTGAERVTYSHEVRSR